MNYDKEKPNTINTISTIFPRDIEKITVKRKEVEDGYYINTFYPFYPGIYLFLNEVHATNINAGTFPKETQMIVINYCLSGRCEFKAFGDKYKYLTDNNISIGGYVVKESFFYPSDFYLGFEVGIIEELFTKETWDILNEFQIDINCLNNLSKNNNGLLILEANSEVQKIWLDMYSDKDEDPYIIKLNMLKILRILSKNELANDTSTLYLTKGQMEIARAVHKRLTQDLSVHISIRQISEELNISQSSLKKYFKIMFDMNVSEYMKIARLKKAAKMLAETDISIFDIADLCGYTNQGRFAKIFKEYYGMRPLEYRQTSIKFKK
ncbi:MAG: helix-turn-helix transcriptional regulator [Eubacterium sp.]|nr:helix-turn-helix transcriptional regulator [Eubacterium sp.]